MSASEKVKPNVNIHFGIKDVYPSLVSKAADLLKAQMAERSSVFVRSDQYKNTIRPALANLAASGRSKEISIGQYSDLSYVANGTKNIAISQHGALDNFAKVERNLVSQSDPLAILFGLEDFFKPAAICVHLMIVCQHDYGPIVDSVDPQRSIISWADMASEILRAVPSAALVVWVLDDPQAYAVQFVVRMLGLEGVFLSNELVKQITLVAREQRFGRPIKPIGTYMDRLSQYLDAQYERDLVRLQEMPRVSVIGG